ncbi:disease resistance protein RUN1 isoform X2 [Pyrus x bretschneideri]|uniref:disease resistance protein RUN1 isoform X2 n=1 Tax=Pyrus x bretschneideri TaxID=225117 RepID=UPI002030469E|nr:disease resistance protein RUN1 isoform X2 [Pyrus x bretschneideri]
MATTQSRKRRKPNIPLGSTSPTQPTCYDVFLGFFGPDTRRGFAGRLDAVLSERGVVVYRDDDYEYYGVEPINSQIRKAIESSRISIVILSRNYARSIWCLDLLKLILDCRQVTGQIVLPVFYNVDPSDVRKQKGVFGTAFAGYERYFKDNIDKERAWRDDAQLINEIVECILNILQPVAPDVKQQSFALGSTAPTQPTDYDVYLSFRGDDTGMNFASHLYAALSRNRVVVRRDKDYLRPGAEPINSQIRKAIESSRFSIVIFTRNYASSTGCLDELQQIVDCGRVTGLRVIPVFYDVNPSEVRHQKGDSWGDAFYDHELRFKDNIDKVRTWRNALHEVTSHSGFALTAAGYEAQLVARIVEFILNALQPVASDVEQLVGIESRVEELNTLLDIESNDVRFIGIWGVGGIGKTTIADVIFNNISIEFEIFTRICNIRELSETQGDLQLQKKLLYEALRLDTDVPNVNEGAIMIRNILCKRKVLLILDDVDNLHQLESLAGNREWFGLGSRVIVTTRNEKLLRKHGVDSIFEVKELSERESLRLFNIYAFKSVESPEDYLNLSKQFVNYCRGIPFAIKVLGSSLFHRSLEEWHSVLKKREHFPDETVSQILELSYHGLADNEKRMFLDIACFFQGMDKERVVEILDCFGFNSKYGMEALIERSLITISNNKVLMNGLIQEMGRQVVRRDAVADPGEQSRLWLHEDVIHVLRNNTGTKAVEGIALDLPKLKEACWDLEAFSTMHNLRFLQIHNLRMTQGPKKLSNALKFLEWSGYPSESLPQEFELEQLCEVNLCHSSIGQLWSGTKCLGNLKFVNVSYSQNLTRTPNFTVTPNLHRLILEGCTKLVMIDPSIAELKRLIFLNLRDCRSLEHLPERFGMESLQILILSGCSKINKVPEFVRPMENLLELHLDKTAVEELPSSIECLTGLTLLNLRDCRNLSSLASSDWKLRSLKSLNLSGCSKLEELPKDLGNMVSLKELDVGGTSINDLPSSISRLKKLELLSLCGCKSMRRKKTSPLSLLLPTTDSSLLSLTILNLSDCNLEEVTILESLGCLSSIVSLNLSNNSFVSLPKSITGLSKLQILNLGGCKRLKKLPDISAELNLSVEGKGSSSQKGLSSCFSFINCFEVIEDQGCNNVAFAALRRFLEGIPYVGNKFEAIYPGSEVSEWFSYRSERPVVSVELPQHWYENEWMGYVLCAVFTLRRRLPPNLLGKWNYGTHSSAHGLRCEVKPGNLGVGGWCPSFACSEELGQIEKEHLWLSFISGAYFGTTWQDSCHHLEFTFKTLGHGLEVKRCGVRLIYKRDLVGLKQPF